MNTAPESNNDKLDRLLDESLSNLPEYVAPESLLPNIMARIAVEEQAARLSWLARLRWPVVAVSTVAIFLASYYSRALSQAFLGLINTEQFSGEMQLVGTSINLFSTLGNAFAKVVNLVPAPVFYSIAAMAFIFSALSCAGFGTVLFRLARAGDSMKTHNTI